MSEARRVLLMQGNEAVVEGALAAGMRFYSGYPITPSTEIAELSAQRLPCLGGAFIQMEDEIGGIAAAIGASLTGAKAMTATSGPGFSLKLENIGYAAMAEIPLVIVNVQRGGPSTGLPTSPAQGDVMQARWGTHGDHPVIAITPSSVKESYLLAIRAFNLAEKYRMPVILLTDEVVGHMREKIEIPTVDEIEVVERIKPTESAEEYRPYAVVDGEIVPRMAGFGDGYRYHVTGLFHDETGFPSNSPQNADVMLRRIMDKITDNLHDIIDYDEYLTEDAEFIILSYGSTARTARNAVNRLREEGIKAGLFRPITIWPFPEERVKELAGGVRGILVAEMNLGQLVLEVQRVVEGRTPVYHIGRANGDVLAPFELVTRVKEALA